MYHINRFPQQYVAIVQKQQTPGFSSSFNQNSNSSIISILNENFDFLPRQFTIITNKGSYKFNVDLIKDSSKTVAKQLESEPNNLEYHLDFNDDLNVMKKFEDVFRGLSATIEISELFHTQQIILLLKIENCPMSFKKLQSKFYSIPAKNEIEINRKSLIPFLKLKFPEIITIKTNKNEYKCLKIAVYSSKVIGEFLTKNPEAKEFIYNYEEEKNEFGIISSLFNFDEVLITTENMDFLKTFADDLQIETIIKFIDKFIDTYENSVQLIDEKKLIIDTIDEIFYLLHNIQTITVENVKNSILKSIWVTTDENVQELLACILQAARIGYKLQPYLIELVKSLDESSNDYVKLKNLLPLLVNQLKLDFSKTPFYSSFYFRLAQKGIVKMEDALDNAIQIVTKNKIIKNNNPVNYENEIQNRDIVNVLLWFLPELFDKYKNDKFFCNVKIDIKSAGFFKKFYPSNAEGYRMIRDSGMPIDEIARAIFNDDVDTLQSIISKRGIDINESKIELNLFDVFEFEYNDKLSFINYSVLYGSIKCFKYLLLNHAELDKFTFVLSIYGGNTEIIRSVDQCDPSIYNHTENKRFLKKSIFSFGDTVNNGYYKYNSNYLMNIASPAIMKHQNDILDWIFENKYNSIKNILLDILFIAVQNGNAHAFIQCIDKGLDLNQLNSGFSPGCYCISVLINEACRDGFYRILQLIVSLFKNYMNNSQIQSELIFQSGNILIYNLLKDKAQINNQYFYPIFNSIERFQNSFIMKLIEQNNYFLKNSNQFNEVFNIVIKNKNVELFNFLMNKFTFEKIDNLYLLIFNNKFGVSTILNECCSAGFFEGVKDATEYILSKDQSFDFTTPFYSAVCSKQKEIYKYLLDKNVNITLKPNDPLLYGITQIENDLCIKIIDKINHDVKEDVMNELFNLAVSNGNKNLVELLLDKSRINYSSLIDAVKSSNIDVVNLILSLNSEPTFINFVQENGTALNIAVKKNNIEIVKRLLSLPEINTTLYDNDDCTPLMTAIKNFNVEIIDLILDFYGDDISSQIWQINEGIKKILSFLSKSEEILENDEDKNKDDDENNDDEQLNVCLFDNKSTFIINKEKIFDTISKLSKIDGVDLNCNFSSNTLLFYACEMNDNNLFQLLLKTNKVNVNKYSQLTGDTPLMIAIQNNNIEIAQFLIEHAQTDINHRNYIGQTALTLAALKDNDCIVNSLISNNKFDIKLSSLFDAYFISKNRITELLLNVKGFDVNFNMKIKHYIKLFDEKKPCYQIEFSSQIKIPFITPLIKAVIDLKIDMIDLIVNQPSFDKDKSRYVDAIFASVFMNDIDIFTKLLNLFGSDVNLISNDGKSLLYFSIYMRTGDITTSILNNNSFDSKKSQIVLSFIKAGNFISSSINDTPLFGTPRSGLPLLNTAQPNPRAAFNNIYNVNNVLHDKMNELLNFDEAHDKLIRLNEFLPSGKTYFTSIDPSCQNAGDLVNILIAHGADPNLPDKNGVYPIEYSIYICNSLFQQSLFNLDNINLKIRSSGNYIGSTKDDNILHMMSSTNTFNNFNEIVDLVGEDLINQENINGDTPLLIACRSRNRNHINLLFSIENIDYKHRNKEGKDALDIIESFSNKNQMFYKNYSNMNTVNDREFQDEEKREYYQKIMKHIYSCI